MSLKQSGRSGNVFTVEVLGFAFFHISHYILPVFQKHFSFVQFAGETKVEYQKSEEDISSSVTEVRQASSWSQDGASVSSVHRHAWSANSDGCRRETKNLRQVDEGTDKK